MNDKLQNAIAIRLENKFHFNLNLHVHVLQYRPWFQFWNLRTCTSICVCSAWKSFDSLASYDFLLVLVEIFLRQNLSMLWSMQAFNKIFVIVKLASFIYRHTRVRVNKVFHEKKGEFANEKNGKRTKMSREERITWNVQMSTLRAMGK